MRILMLGDARTEHLSRWARHFRQRGDTVWTASAQAGPKDIQLELPVRWPAAGYPLLVPVVRRLITELTPDLLVGHYLPDYGLITVLSGFVPHVVIAWGSDLLVLPRRNPLQRARLRLVARRGQAFLVDAQMLVKPLAALGAPAERIFVCPFGVDDDLLQRSSTRSATDGVTTILSTRRHEATYRIDLLLEAGHILETRGEEFQLNIAGEGTETTALKKRAGDLGLEGRLRWTGHLDRADYVSALGDVDIYVSTSPSDSTLVSLLEAMAARLAVVVPDIDGNREWITSGQNGLLYAPGDAGALADALAELVSHPERRRALGTRARARVEQDGRWSRTIRRAELLFTQLVEH